MFAGNSMNSQTVSQLLRVGRGWVAGVGRPVGYALCADDGQLTDLLRIGVRKHHRQNGLGQAILQQVLAGQQAVSLSVRKDNHAAIRMYLRAGFRIIGHLVGFDGPYWALLHAS